MHVKSFCNRWPLYEVLASTLFLIFRWRKIVGTPARCQAVWSLYEVMSSHLFDFQMEKDWSVHLLDAKLLPILPTPSMLPND